MLPAPSGPPSSNPLTAGSDTAYVTYTLLPTLSNSPHRFRLRAANRSGRIRQNFTASDCVWGRAPSMATVKAMCHRRRLRCAAVTTSWPWPPTLSGCADQEPNLLKTNIISETLLACQSIEYLAFNYSTPKIFFQSRKTCYLFDNSASASRSNWSCLVVISR